MTTSALSIRVALRIASLAEFPDARAIQTGLGVTAHIQGASYPGKILECKKPISPGESGEAKIGVFLSNFASIGFREGMEFELRNGMNRTFATATVISYEIV